MILVNDLIIATDGETKLYLIQPDSTGFKPIASASLFKKVKFPAMKGLSVLLVQMKTGKINSAV